MTAALPKIKEEIERVTAPALKLIRQGKFVVQWEALNPWTTANVPGMRKVVAESAESLAREMVDS